MPKPKAPARIPSRIRESVRTLNPVSFAALTLAGVVNAFGVTVFLFPVKLYDSGISGLSMLLDQVTPDWLTLPLFLLLFDLPIFLFAVKKQGFAFTAYSLWAVGVYSFVSWLIMDVLPVDVSFVSPLAGSDLLLCAIFGGAISGVGSGLTIRFGGAIDGIDVLSVVFAKRIGISIGSFVLVFNTVLYIACGIAIHSWILPLYSIVTYFVGSKTVDFVVEGINKSKCAMIVTGKPEAVSRALSESFSASGTVLRATGGYSGEEKAVIYFVTNQFGIGKLKTVVHREDPSAFISLLDVTDVFRSRS